MNYINKDRITTTGFWNKKIRFDWRVCSGHQFFIEQANVVIHLPSHSSFFSVTYKDEVSGEYSSSSNSLSRYHLPKKLSENKNSWKFSFFGIFVNSKDYYDEEDASFSLPSAASVGSLFHSDQFIIRAEFFRFSFLERIDFLRIYVYFMVFITILFIIFIYFFLDTRQKNRNFQDSLPVTTNSSFVGYFDFLQDWCFFFQKRHHRSVFDIYFSLEPNDSSKIRDSCFVSEIVELCVRGYLQIIWSVNSENKCSVELRKTNAFLFLPDEINPSEALDDPIPVNDSPISYSSISSQQPLIEENEEEIEIKSNSVFKFESVVPNNNEEEEEEEEEELYMDLNWGETVFLDTLFKGTNRTVKLPTASDSYDFLFDGSLESRVFSRRMTDKMRKNKVMGFVLGFVIPLLFFFFFELYYLVFLPPLSLSVLFSQQLFDFESILMIIIRAALPIFCFFFTNCLFFIGLSNALTFFSGNKFSEKMGNKISSMKDFIEEKLLSKPEEESEKENNNSLLFLESMIPFSILFGLEKQFLNKFFNEVRGKRHGEYIFYTNWFVQRIIGEEEEEVSSKMSFVDVFCSMIHSTHEMVNETFK